MAKLKKGYEFSQQMFTLIVIIFGTFGGVATLIQIISRDWIAAAITALIVIVPYIALSNAKKLANNRMEVVKSRNYSVSRAECLEKWTKQVRRHKRYSYDTYVKLSGFDDPFSLDFIGDDIEEGDLVDVIVPENGDVKGQIIIKALTDGDGFDSESILYKAVLESVRPDANMLMISHAIRVSTGASSAEAEEAVKNAPSLILNNQILSAVENLKKDIDGHGGKVEIYEQDRAAMYCHTLEVNEKKKSCCLFGLF